MSTAYEICVNVSRIQTLMPSKKFLTQSRDICWVVMLYMSQLRHQVVLSEKQWQTSLCRRLLFMLLRLAQSVQKMCKAAHGGDAQQ